MSFSKFNGLPAFLVGTATVAAIVFSQPASAKTAKEVAQIAVPTTVRIDTSAGVDKGGSGVIIARDGNTYTVLTAHHVVANQAQEYKIYTSQKKTYTVQAIQSLQKGEKDPDLAIVKFESPEEYPVAPLSNSDDASIGSGIYISGYPMSIEVSGEREYEFTAGQVTSRPDSRPQGYTLRYDAVTRRGMSGGPVFDVNGRVVGIHGQGDRDGVVKNESAGGGQTEIKTGFNAAIPVNTFKSLIAQAGINIPLQVDNTPAENVVATQPTRQDVRSWADDFALGLGLGLLRQVIPIPSIPGLPF